MISQVEAIYENGVFRPLNAFAMTDSERVLLTISIGDHPHFAVPDDCWEEFCQALDGPAKMIPTLQSLLSEPGTFDDRTPNSPSQ
jgi:predicted DNA-binding antitoxin AbrB/MazE fold protein